MMPDVPEEFAPLQNLTRRAVAPMRPVDEGTRARHDFLFSGKQAIGPDGLPPPYLIYFLLVDLLGFKDLGRFEKLAWSIPIDFEGKAVLIEHRKFGVGVFVQDDADFEMAEKIAMLLKKGVRCAKPYFKWKADQAVSESRFNVVNNADMLLRRFHHLKGLYTSAYSEAERRKDEVVVTKFKNGASYEWPYHRLSAEASWLAMAAIEAFYSWTEHLFVHIAILRGSVASGAEFSTLSGAEWGTKFKHALDVSDATIKSHYDSLIEARRQLRNFIAHGSFGKSGEALHFHSSAGAVPVQMDVTKQRGKFSLGEGLKFDAEYAFEVIEAFIAFLSTGPAKPAWIYAQEFGLPSILTMTRDGKYHMAMESPEAMEAFALHLARQMDNAANMDW